MDEIEFLEQVGWPQEGLSDFGLLKWQVPSTDEALTVATAIRGQDGVALSIRRVFFSGDGFKDELLEATIAGGGRGVVSAKAGHPPEAIMPEDACDLFKFMVSGMGKPSFVSSEPGGVAQARSDGGVGGRMHALLEGLKEKGFSPEQALAVWREGENFGFLSFGADDADNRARRAARDGYFEG